MFTRKTYNYIPLASKSPECNDGAFNFEHTRTQPVRKTSTCHWIGHGISLAIILLMFSHASIHKDMSWAHCWNMHNYFSPIDEGVASLPFIETRFNGSLWHESPFKGPPTPHTAEAWHSVMKYGMIGVQASDIEAVGHSIKTAARFPDSADGGYIGVAVGTHQLHCLHYIWQDHHRSHFEEVQQKIKDIPEMYERHYEHCVDYVRQSLMCNFDATLVTYDWVLDHQNPTPNSNAMHKCVDWDRAQDWLKSRAVEMPDGFEWSQPEGQESLPWNP